MVATSGQAGSQPDADERRGAGGASLDDAVFISRDREVSIFQSVLENYLETQHADALTATDAAPGRGGSWEKRAAQSMPARF